MSEQATLFESPRDVRAEAMAEAHRAGRFYVEPTTLPMALPDPPHRARSADPVTSHRAADHVEATGQAQREAAIVLRSLRDLPGRTSRELAELAGLDRYMVARRLPELREAGHAENGPDRACASSGRSAMTWTATNPYHPNGGR